MKLPYLPYETWTHSRMTLHLIFQIIGKIRLTFTPRKNHWWYTTLYLSSEGFTTQVTPMGDGLNTFEIVYNVHKQIVEFKSSKGVQKDIQLREGYSVSDFYKALTLIFKDWGVQVAIIDKPYDLGIDKHFSEITEYHHHDQEAVFQFWQMMLWVDGVFKEFSGRFYGKTCPVHIYWHHMDLAVTRFSGKSAPPLNEEASIPDKDAYSHEVISFGFWAGDDNLPEPAFYAYTAPSPAQIEEEPLIPEAAFWMEANGSPMAILKYKDLLPTADPRKVLLDFLESAYLAGAKRANWDWQKLQVPPLEEM